MGTLVSHFYAAITLQFSLGTNECCMSGHMLGLGSAGVKKLSKTIAPNLFLGHLGCTDTAL